MPPHLPRYRRHARFASDAFVIVREGLLPQRRLVTAGGLLLFVVTLGALGYWLIGGGAWTPLDCLYMTVITLSTVGFGETLPGMAEVPGARIWTLCLIVGGSGSLLYFASTLIAFVVEGDLRGAIRRNRMETLITSMRDHVIVCGIGETGIHVVEELLSTQTPFVVVDRNAERIRWAAEELEADLLHIVGDATDEDTLFAAGILHARGIVSTLHDDPENLYVTITARALNENIRVVSKALHHAAVAKLRRAGANAVVLPHLIGGMRIVSEMIRPQVVAFLDRMLQDAEHPLRIAEIEIKRGSDLVGKRIRDAGLRSRANALVLAIRRPGGFEYNPDAGTILSEGMTLIVMGEVDGLQRLSG